MHILRRQLLARFIQTSEEAARKITDGTENPSPPGESISLIRGKYAEDSADVNEKFCELNIRVRVKLRFLIS